MYIASNVNSLILTYATSTPLRRHLARPEPRRSLRSPPSPRRQNSIRASDPLDFNRGVGGAKKSFGGGTRPLGEAIPGQKAIRRVLPERVHASPARKLGPIKRLREFIRAMRRRSEMTAGGPKVARGCCVIYELSRRLTKAAKRIRQDISKRVMKKGCDARFLAKADE